MKTFILTIICLFSGVWLSAQVKQEESTKPSEVVIPFEENPRPVIGELPEAEIINECIAISWTAMNAPNDLVRRNCLPESFAVKITRSRCPYTSNTLIGAIWLEAPGIIFPPQNIPSSGNIFFSGKYAELTFPTNGYNFLDFKLMMEFQVLNNKTGAYSDPQTVELEQYAVQVLEDGMEYTITRFVGPGPEFELCPIDEDALATRVCCEDSETKTYRYEKVTKRTIAGQANLELELSNEGITRLVNLPIPSFSLGFELGIEEGESIIIRKDLILSAEGNECKYPGLKLTTNRYALQTYRVDCVLGDQFIGETEFWRNMGIEQKACTFQMSVEDCNGVLTSPQLIPGGGKSVNDCLGSIILNPNESPDDLYVYTWTGPNGFFAMTQDLFDVPYGAYTVTIRNGCCDIYEETIFLCPNESYSNWQKDETSGQYCRERYCEGCSDPFMECLDPEYGPWTFNSETRYCERSVFLNGEELEEPESKAATYEDEYDDFFNECIRTYYCEGSPYQEIAEPTYSDWQYDDFSENCYREVICFGNNSGEIPEQTVEPDIEWEYDDFFGQCVGYIYCDDSFFRVDNIEEDPSYGDWDYDEVNQECVATVYCGDGEDSGQATFEREIVDADLDETYFICELEVSCGGEIFYESENITTAPDGFDSNGNSLCAIYCAGAYQLTEICSLINDLRGTPGLNTSRQSSSTQFTEVNVFPNPFTSLITIGNLPVDRAITVRLFSLDGKLLRSSTMESGSQQMQIDTQDMVSGLYLLEVSDQQGIIYRRKIAKMP